MKIITHNARCRKKNDSMGWMWVTLACERTRRSHRTPS